VLDTHIKQLDYCCTIPDNKKLFLGKYKICSLALIYALIEYPYVPFKDYIIKFQSYDYNFLQLLKIDASFKDIMKLIILRKTGFIFMVKLYKLFGIYKKS
jgi:hypothetical protein